MNTIEERVAYLEGRMEDHTAANADLRTTVREFRDETGRRFGEVRSEIAGLRGDMNRQFGDVRGEFTGVRGEIADLRGGMNHRFELVDQKVDRHFTWLVGLQITSLLAVMSAIAGLYLR